MNRQEEQKVLSRESEAVCEKQTEISEEALGQVTGGGGIGDFFESIFGKSGKEEKQEKVMMSGENGFIG